VKCPICGEFDENDNFTCPKCNREYICGKHYDYDYLVCTDCSAKIKEEKRKKLEAEKKEKEKKVRKAPKADELKPIEVKEEKSPFYYKKARCPVCGSYSENKYFHAKMYSERKTEIDKQVILYGWKNPEFKKYHPPLYYFWHCKGCKYTDSYLEFENPMKNMWSNFRTVADSFEQKMENDDKFASLVELLSSDISFDNMDFLSSIKLHLLAIAIQECIDDEKERDPFKLGRYYLRYGWLFRDMKTNEEFGKQLPSVNQFIPKVRKFWKEVPSDERTALGYAARYLNIAFKVYPGIKSMVAEVDLLLMIAGIYLKMNNHQKALEYMNMVIQRGQKSKMKIETRLRDIDHDKVGSLDEEHKLSIQLKKIGVIVSRARDTMLDIQQERFKAEKAKAEKIIAKLKDKTPAEIREILIKKGIDRKVAIKLTPEIKKKKFLGLF